MKKFYAAVVTLITLVVLWVSLSPIFEKMRDKPSITPNTECINNLRKIRNAKSIAASELGWTDDVHCDKEDNRRLVNQYISGGNPPACPEGGRYTYGKITDNPICSKG